MVLDARALRRLWLPAFTPSPRGALRLVCIPHAGAGASIYRRWSGLLPPSILVSPVQLPGREERYSESPKKSIQEIAEELAPILGASVDGSFALFGYSMGALIAFETARQLRKQGLPMPCGIIVAAHQPPQQSIVRKPIYHLPEDEFLTELREIGGMPEELFDYPELLEFVLPALRSDLQACDTYFCTPEEPLAVPFAVVGGRYDPHVPTESLIDWKEQSSEPCSVDLLPGGHFFLRESRDLLLERVLQCLSRWKRDGFNKSNSLA